MPESYPATWLFEDLAQDAGVTADELREYLRREIERRTEDAPQPAVRVEPLSEG